jgi:hypothetical protein
MSYHDQLHPWCIIRNLPNAQTLIVARFRRCGDAEAHLKVLRRLMPHEAFELMFDSGEGNEQIALRRDQMSKKN